MKKPGPRHLRTSGSARATPRGAAFLFAFSRELSGRRYTDTRPCGFELARRSLTSGTEAP